MKAKRFGLVSMSLMLLSGTATGGYLGWQVLHPVLAKGVQQEIPGGNAVLAKDSMEIPVINTADRTTMRTRLPELEQLRVPAAPVQGEVSMVMLGFDTQFVDAAQAVASRPDEDLSSHIVSMAYVSGGDRFAVIDGEMYQEGDELKGEEGTKVRDITTEKVLLSGRSVRQWVKVFNPVKVEKKVVKEEEKKVEKRVEKKVEKQPFVDPDAPKTGAGGLAEALQTFKSYSDVMNSLKAGQ
ncbi:MAG: hypothetical protein HQM02_01935 [Magnetococcales bacterium]|nr:hypothetical protein [Magnetococcales bacterium]